MTESKSNICPCCSKGCDLSRPHCGRGEEYLRTGVISSRDDHRKDASAHRHRGIREDASTAEKLFFLLSRMGRIGHHVSGGRESQKRILSILHKNGGMSQRALTETLGIQPGSASEILKKLESAGYLLRQADPQDRRGVNLSLTKAGAEEAATYTDQHQSDIDALFAALSDEEQLQLLALLEKLVQSWHGCHPEKGHHHGGEHRHRHRKGF